MTIFTQDAVAALQPVLDRLIVDPRVGVTVTVQQMGDKTWDEDTGKNVTTITETSVSAIKKQHTEKTVAKLIGNAVSEKAQITVGDLYFVIRCADITGKIKPKDVVVYDGQAMKVKDAQARIDFVWIVTVEGA